MGAVAQRGGYIRNTRAKKIDIGWELYDYAKL